ncbi:MAG TPA: hypothetical protein VMW76_06070 [Bacteroidales bacterium]|nr:hypothetical protein [Bacteroidales bacterium]
MKKLNILVILVMFPICLPGQNEWEEVFLRFYNSDYGPRLYCVMSELDPVDPFEGLSRYGGQNMFDNNPATAWVEGEKGYGKGISLYVSAGEEIIESMSVRNGYQKSNDLFTKNSRVKNIRISIMAGFFIEGQVTEFESVYHARQIGESKMIILADVNDEQNIKLPWKYSEIEEAKEIALEDFRNDFRVYLERAREMCPTCPPGPDFKFILKLEIVDVYPGSAWDDTCISELIAITAKPDRDDIPAGDKIEEVYEDPETGKIFVDTDARKGIVLVDEKEVAEAKELNEDEHLSITLMDVSPEKEWAQVDFMLSHEGAGRVEEYSVLYHVRSLTRVNTSILKTMYGMYGFTRKGKKIYLDTADGLVDLEEILAKIKNQ